MLNDGCFAKIIPTSNHKKLDMVVISGYSYLELTMIGGGLLSSSDLMKLLKENGWVLDRVRGSHHIFVKDGVDHHITVPHPRKDVAKGTLHDILKNM